MAVMFKYLTLGCAGSTVLGHTRMSALDDGAALVQRSVGEAALEGDKPDFASALEVLTKTALRAAGDAAMSAMSAQAAKSAMESKPSLRDLFSSKNASKNAVSASASRSGGERKPSLKDLLTGGHSHSDRTPAQTDSGEKPSIMDIFKHDADKTHVQAEGSEKPSIMDIFKHTTPKPPAETAKKPRASQLPSPTASPPLPSLPALPDLGALLASDDGFGMLLNGLSAVKDVVLRKARARAEALPADDDVVLRKARARAEALPADDGVTESDTRAGVTALVERVINGIAASESSQRKRKLADWAIDAVMEVRNITGNGTRAMIDSLAGLDLANASSLGDVLEDFLLAMNSSGFRDAVYDLTPAVPVLRTLESISRAAGEVNATKEDPLVLWLNASNLTEITAALRGFGNVPLHDPSKLLNDVASIFDRADAKGEYRHAAELASDVGGTVLEAPFLANCFFLFRQLLQAGRFDASSFVNLAEVMRGVPPVPVNSTGLAFRSLAGLLMDYGMWHESGNLSSGNAIPRLAAFAEETGIVGSATTTDLVNIVEGSKYYICNLNGTAGLAGCEGAVLKRPTLPAQ